MTFHNPLLAALDQQRPALGCFLAIPSAVAAEQVATVGFDYVGVDLQHGAIGYSEALSLFPIIQAGGCAPLARLNANDPNEIGKILDAGAHGVIVPLVNTAEDAERAVAACRFPPRGRRSFGPVRAATAMGSREIADLEQVACFAMVETADGLANLDEIAAVPGLTGLYVGPADLALALGLSPAYEPAADEHRVATESIRTAAKRHGITAAVHCDGGACGTRRLAQGFDMVTLGTDLAHLRQRLDAELGHARG